MFFYWLIAISYKAFGVNEWAARLASVLAALSCFALVYRFALIRWGPWEALWSGLILISGVDFFILSRIVIFDMSLTFCITLALYSFTKRRMQIKQCGAGFTASDVWRLGCWYSHQRPCWIDHSRLNHFLLSFGRQPMVNSALCLSYSWCIIVSGARFSLVSSGRGTKRRVSPLLFVGRNTLAALPPQSLIENNPGVFSWELSLLGFFPGACCFRASLNATARNRWMAEEFFCYHGASYR
jgi:Dolichyl-phosphate-mannose-protein mannosyltransferase